jgi:predicted nuclease with TOPRIM domain
VVTEREICMLLPYIIGAFGVVATACSAFFIARRTTRGTVSTTEAATLWSESTRIRQELAERAATLQMECDRLRAKVSEVEGRCLVLEREIVRCRESNEDSQRIVTTLHARVDDLVAQLDQARGNS